MGIYTRIPVAAAICESEDESYAWRGDPSASVTLLVPWQFRYMVVSDLLGFDWDYKKNGKETHRAGSSLPRKHPNAGNYKVTSDQSYAGMYVKSVSIKGVGAAKREGQENAYEMAELTVSYSMLPQRSYTENINYEVQSMTLPRHLFCWDKNTPLSDGEEPVKMMRTLSITHTYNFLEKIPNMFAENVGKVNSDVLETSQKLTIQPETLLYEGCETSQTWTYTGSEGWSLTVHFAYNPNGWNKWYNNISEKWMTIKKITGATEGQEPEYIGNGQWTTPGLEEFKMYEPCKMKDIFNFDPEKEYKDNDNEGEGGDENGGDENGSGGNNNNSPYSGSNQQNILLGADELLQWTQELYGVGADKVNEWLQKFYREQEQNQSNNNEPDENDGDGEDNNSEEGN